MKLDRLHNFDRHEKVATLKLFIKIAASDEIVTDDERQKIEEFVEHSNLKMTSDFIAKSASENIDDIMSAFRSKSNLKLLYSILKQFAESFGVDPDYEGRMLDAIKESIEQRKKHLKFNVGDFAKSLLKRSSFTETRYAAMRSRAATTEFMSDLC